MEKPLDISVLSTLARSRTADICDAAEADLALHVQVLALEMKSFGGSAHYSGEVETASCAEIPFVREILESPGRGRILVVDAHGDPAQAVIGDRLGALALEGGWSGLIVHGYVRDSFELSKLRIGVHALGTRPNRAGAFQPAQTGKSLNFGGVRIVPGMWVTADHDGIVFWHHSPPGTTASLPPAP